MLIFGKTPMKSILIACLYSFKAFEVKELADLSGECLVLAAQILLQNP